MDTFASLEVLKAFAEGVGRESVNKLSTAIGALFPFYGAKKVAVSTYIEDIKNSDLSPEEKLIAISGVKKRIKQLNNQIKIAQIAMNSAKEGTDFSMASQVDDEWLDRFMDSAKFVSNEEVQNIWGKILAGEFENPGSTPPSTVRILSEITAQYARAFQVLCSLEVELISRDFQKNTATAIKQIILPPEYDYLSEYGISFATLTELSAIGLINPPQVTNYVFRIPREDSLKLRIKYGTQVASILEYNDMAFPAGKVLLTRVGTTIYNLIDKSIIPTHFEAVCQYFKNEGVMLSKID